MTRPRSSRAEGATVASGGQQRSETRESAYQVADAVWKTGTSIARRYASKPLGGRMARGCYRAAPVDRPLRAVAAFCDLLHLGRGARDVGRVFEALGQQRDDADRHADEGHAPRPALPIGVLDVSARAILG